MFGRQDSAELDLAVVEIEYLPFSRGGAWCCRSPDQTWLARHAVDFGDVCQITSTSYQGPFLPLGSGELAKPLLVTDHADETGFFLSLGKSNLSPWYINHVFTLMVRAVITFSKLIHRGIGQAHGTNDELIATRCFAR